MNDSEELSEIEIAQTVEPESESELTFQGKKIRTAKLRSGQGYVSVRSLCDAFGINFSGQRQRILRTSLFHEYSMMIRVFDGRARRPQLCMSAFVVPAFLLGVETGRIANEAARAALDAFQEEGMIVLAEHFGLSERGEIRFLRESVSRMVIQQEAFESQVVANVEKELAADRQAREEKIQQIRDAFSKMRDQIRTLEKAAGPRQRITPEQLGQLRHTVMVLGEMMIMSGENKKPWPAIYTGISLQFGFPRAEDITQEMFPEVLEFLDHQFNAFRELLLKQRPGG